MIRIALCGALLLAAALSPAGARASDARDAAIAPVGVGPEADTGVDGDAAATAMSRAAENGFSAAIAIVTEAEATRFHREWHSTAVEHAPSLTRTDSARRGETVLVLLLYAGCAPEDATAEAIDAGRAACDAQVRLRTYGPADDADGDGDGDTGNQDPPEMSLARGQPAAPAHIVQLSPVVLKIRFGPEDAPGEYRVEARVDHPDRDAVLRLAATVTLLPDR